MKKLVIALCLLAGCAGNQDEIRIGGIGPLSAPGSYESGREMRMAMEIAIEEINSQGGLLGKNVRLMFEDTQGLPEKGTAAVERLITKGKVSAIVGEFHSSVCTAVVEVANKLKTPFVISECYADKLTANQYRYIFRVAPTNSFFYSKVAEWIREQGFKNISMITENTDWGLDVERVLKKIFKSEGISYNSMVAERTVQDFTPQLLVIKRMNPRPDLILNNFTGTGEYLIIKQAHEIGLAPAKETAVFAMGIDALHPEFWETVGQAGEDVLIKNSFYPGVAFTSKTNNFIKKFKNRFNRDPILPALEAYDSVIAVAEAIKIAGSTDKEAIVDALEKVKFEGLRGEVAFSTEREPAWKYHQYVEQPVLVLQYEKLNQNPNEAPILWPNNLKTGSFTRPAK